MKRTAMVALLVVASGSALAAHPVPGWRVGAAASFNDFDWTDGDIDLIEDSTVGVKLYTQYQFNKWLGLEGAYHNTGDFEELSTAPSPNDGNLDLSFDGFSGALLGYIPLPSEEIQAYAKVGFYDFDSELSRNGAVSSSGSEDGLMAGAGAMIEIADNFGIRADFDWFDADVGDLWAVNLGLEYFFGGKKAAPVVAAAAAPEPEPEPEPAPAPVAVAPPPDADGDGVTDDVDQCPDTPQGDRVGQFGCSCDVSRQVEFDFDSAELTDAGRATLEELADTLGRLKFVEGTVEGHTDSVGAEDFNQGLSERRAQAVADFLEAKGIAAGRLTVKGFGETMPIADNDTEEGRAQNRRVVLRRTDCESAQ